MYSTFYSCQILMKLELSRLILEEKCLDNKLMKIRLMGVELFHVDERTGRQTLHSCQSLFEILRTHLKRPYILPTEFIYL